METKTGIIEPIIEKAEQYANTSYELIRLKTVEKMVGAASIALFYGVAVLLLALFITILNIGVALWIGEQLGKTYYGFFCVAGFYVLVIVILFLIQNPIKKAASNTFIKHIL